MIIYVNLKLKWSLLRFSAQEFLWNKMYHLKWKSRCEDVVRKTGIKNIFRVLIFIKGSMHSNVPKMNSFVGEGVVSKISKEDEWDSTGDDGEKQICRFIAEEGDRHKERIGWKTYGRQRGRNTEECFVI